MVFHVIEGHENGFEGGHFTFSAVDESGVEVGVGEGGEGGGAGVEGGTKRVQSGFLVSLFVVEQVLFFGGEIVDEEEGAVGDVDLVFFVVEAGHFTSSDAKVLELIKPGTKVVLLSNKVDQVNNKEELMPWMKDMQERFDFYAIFPMSAKSSKDIERLVQLCIKDLPEQAWWYLNDELTDRSEKFLASEIIREKLFRLTGDELPYTSTVIIDKFTEEPGRSVARMIKIAATIVVEREGHKAMVIGEKGEKLKRMGTDARQELERLMDAKVFLEIWVKVRSGWADDEARVRSFGYE